MRLKSVILFFLLSTIFVYPQTKSELKEIYDDAEYFFIREEYSEALYFYMQLLKYDANNANLNFKAGTCLLKIKGQGPRAIPFLQKAVKDISPNYNKRSFNEQKAPLHALYFLGDAYRINNDLDKALEMYRQFIGSPDYYQNYNDRMVNEEIKSCERAKIVRDNPIDITEINIGPEINTKTNDYSAVVSGNEKVMVFVTSLKFYEGLFFAVKDNDVWQPPVNINGQVVSDGDMFPTGLSYDGAELYLIKKTDVNNDIYYSRYENGLWTKAMPLGSNVNSKNNEDYASVSKDGKTLYFTSDRRGGFGGFDIYKSLKTGNQWGEPLNLGDAVNSPFDESAPFITGDGTKLYFSSNGHFNMGGYDIFFSELKNNVWQVPVNVGFPLNTTSDNMFFVPVENGNAGYMSLERNNGIGNEDIYKIEIGSASPMKNEKIVKSLQDIDLNTNNVKLKLVNEETGDTTVMWFNKSTSRFFFDVPEGMKIIVEENK